MIRQAQDYRTDVDDFKVVLQQVTGLGANHVNCSRTCGRKVSNNVFRC